MCWKNQRIKESNFWNYQRIKDSKNLILSKNQIFETIKSQRIVKVSKNKRNQWKSKLIDSESVWFFETLILHFCLILWIFDSSIPFDSLNLWNYLKLDTLILWYYQDTLSYCALLAWPLHDARGISDRQALIGGWAKRKPVIILLIDWY